MKSKAVLNVDPAANEQIGEGFAFACWLWLRAKARRWHPTLVARVHGWHCHGCRAIWYEQNPKGKQ